MSNYVYFWGTSNPDTGFLSNWYLHKIRYGEYLYNCIEQGMMHQKALIFKDHVTAAKILLEPSPREQKKLGRQVANFFDKLWDMRKEEIVSKMFVSKYCALVTDGEDSSDELFAKFLAFPKDSIFVEASPYDKIWGIGLSEEEARKVDPKDWPGQNLLGKIITEHRRRFP